jgi:hypothetical protein
MDLCLQIVHEPAGSWAVCGLADKPVAHLPSLAASVDYARRECAAAPATIELMIDGFYAVVHQRDGWPHNLVAPQLDVPRMAAKEEGRSENSPFRRWCGWVTGRRRD